MWIKICVCWIPFLDNPWRQLRLSSLRIQYRVAKAQRKSSTCIHQVSVNLPLFLCVCLLVCGCESLCLCFPIFLPVFPFWKGINLRLLATGADIGEDLALLAAACNHSIISYGRTGRTWRTGRTGVVVIAMVWFSKWKVFSHSYHITPRVKTRKILWHIYFTCQGIKINVHNE